MVNIDTKFDDVVLNIKTLKENYNCSLASFRYFEKKQLIEYKKSIRNNVYSLQFEEWKKDKIWNFLNGFEEFETLENLIKR